MGMNEVMHTVEHRKLYLIRIEVILLMHASPPFCEVEKLTESFIGPQHKRVVLLFHDENTFHSNEDQR